MKGKIIMENQASYTTRKIFNVIIFIGLAVASYYSLRVPIPSSINHNKLLDTILQASLILAAILFFNNKFAYNIGSFVAEEFYGYAFLIISMSLLRLIVYFNPESNFLQWGSAIFILLIFISVTLYWLVTKCPQCWMPRRFATHYSYTGITSHRVNVDSKWHCPWCGTSTNA
jgi:hypothetical protein